MSNDNTEHVQNIFDVECFDLTCKYYSNLKFVHNMNVK